MESMDTVSLQAVTLADGSTAYIQHDSKSAFSDGQIMDGQVIQLEDGSAAYVQHVSMPKAGKAPIPVVSPDHEHCIAESIWSDSIPDLLSSEFMTRMEAIMSKLT